MIGTYRLDVEVWNLEFPITMSVCYYADGRRMSVHLNDDNRLIHALTGADIVVMDVVLGEIAFFFQASS
jgi:hypothetical protein